MEGNRFPDRVKRLYQTPWAQKQIAPRVERLKGSLVDVERFLNKGHSYQERRQQLNDTIRRVAFPLVSMLYHSAPEIAASQISEENLQQGVTLQATIDMNKSAITHVAVGSNIYGIVGQVSAYQISHAIAKAIN